MRSKAYNLGYIIIVALLLVTSYFSLSLFFRGRSMHDKVDIRSFPYEIGGWKGSDDKLTEDVYQMLETRNIVSRIYVNPEGEKIGLFIIYSETNRSVFHPPEVCLIGSGMAIVDKQVEQVKAGGMSFSANKLYVQKGNLKELILYCYKAGSLYTSNFYQQQAYLAFHQILESRISGATVRVSMRIKGDEKVTLAALEDFITKTAKIVDTIS